MPPRKKSKFSSESDNQNNNTNNNCSSSSINSNSINSLDDENKNTSNITLKTLAEEAASLKQLYYGPIFCSDFKILYDDTCLNVHRAFLAHFCKYFETLLSSFGFNEEKIIHLPVIVSPHKKQNRGTKYMNQFFEILYSNKPLTKDLFEKDSKYFIYPLADISHYLECSYIEKFIEGIVVEHISVENKYRRWWWCTLYYAETYHWTEVKEKLIINIGENLYQLRTDEFKECYEIYWPLLTHKTTEAILEAALAKSNYKTASKLLQ